MSGVILDAAMAAEFIDDHGNVVNLCCCEQLITPAVWDEVAGTVSLADSHPAARWSASAATSRRRLQRVKLECSSCGRSTVVRAEKFVPVIEKLLRHGVSKLTLAGLDDILARS